MNLFTKEKQSRRYKIQIYVYQRGWGRGGREIRSLRLMYTHYYI